MRQAVITYLTYDELDEEAKKKALEEHRGYNVEGVEWWDSIFDNTKEVGELMGLDISDIYFRGFSSQGDGACFECRFSHKKGTVSKVKEYAPMDTRLHRIARDIVVLHARSFYTTNGAARQYGHYSHAYSMRLSLDWEKGDENHAEWVELFADFAGWIYERLEHEYEYLTSDEVVAESLTNSGMEFEQ